MGGTPTTGGELEQRARRLLQCSPVTPGLGLQATLPGESPTPPGRAAHSQQGSRPPAWGPGHTLLLGVCAPATHSDARSTCGGPPPPHSTHRDPTEAPHALGRPWGAAPQSQLSQRLGREQTPESPQITAYTKGLKERWDIGWDRGAGCYGRGLQAGHRASLGQKWAQTSDGSAQIQRSRGCRTGVAECAWSLALRLCLSEASGPPRWRCTPFMTTRTPRCHCSHLQAPVPGPVSGNNFLEYLSPTQCLYFMWQVSPGPCEQTHPGTHPSFNLWAGLLRRLV